MLINVASCSRPFLVASPNCKSGAASGGGCVSKVIMSDVACLRKSYICISGIGIV